MFKFEDGKTHFICFNFFFTLAYSHSLTSINVESLREITDKNG